MDTKALAKALKALSHPHRLDLFLEIARKQGCSYDTECGQCLVSEVMGSLNIGAPTISHHVKELANANLIVTERNGKFLQARVNKDLVDEIIRALAV
ncbi:MAG: helix-turn-helix transcriptional regulator [Spirochaetes bacterium]|nr:helix-turn-helix transcriptional regulator [Spirochaetota bacterium]HPA73635.1 helix-turn-helix domain-containing protein [Spirochaetota bacterium]